jgi:PAS domain-containing protein
MSLKSPFLQAILNTSTDAVILINLSGNIQSVNEMATRMFGYASGELVGNNVSMLMPEPFRSNHDGFLKRYAETSKAKIIGNLPSLVHFLSSVRCKTSRSLEISLHLVCWSIFRLLDFCRTNCRVPLERKFPKTFLKQALAETWSVLTRAVVRLTFI